MPWFFGRRMRKKRGLQFGEAITTILNSGAAVAALVATATPLSVNSLLRVSSVKNELIVR
jgi:hypothetical protein